MATLITKNQLKNIVYYDYHSFKTRNGGAEIRIDFLQDVNEHRWYLDGADHMYYRLEDKLVQLFMFLCSGCQEISCFSYQNNKFCSIYRYIRSFAKSKGVRPDEGWGMKTDDMELLLRFFKDALKYEAFPIFLLPGDQFSVTPTDHLDLFISGQKSDIVEIKRRLEGETWFGGAFSIKYV